MCIAVCSIETAVQLQISSAALGVTTCVAAENNELVSLVESTLGPVAVQCEVSAGSNLSFVPHRSRSFEKVAQTVEGLTARPTFVDGALRGLVDVSTTCMEVAVLLVFVG